jgi:steroid delta-isomerase-like uncharacterized protein
MMSDVSSLEVTSQYVAALAAGDTERMNALRAADFELDFVYGDAFASEPLTSGETKQFWPSWLVGFPEMDYEVTRTIAANEVVVTQWVFTGTHDKPIGPPVFDPPEEPTGRTIMFRGVSIYDVREGLIKRETAYIDLATIMVELGVEL